MVLKPLKLNKSTTHCKAFWESDGYTHSAPGLLLTHARLPVLLEAGGAHAPPDGHQPLALGAAVHLGRVALLGVVHAAAAHLHQRGRVGARHHVREHGQVAADAHAVLVVDAHRGERDAGADVLEGQVEAPAAQRAHPPHLQAIRLISGGRRRGRGRAEGGGVRPTWLKLKTHTI